MKESFAKRTTGICCWICFLWRPPIDAETTNSSRNRETTNSRMQERTSVNQVATSLPERHSTAYQETFRVPQNSQQSLLRVNLPPEIILTPAQHITNPECDNDKPPSYESLYNLG